MQKYFLFLDDRRTLSMALKEDPFFNNFLQKSGYNTKIEDIKIAKNATEFIEIIENFGVPEYVSFDHDLGDFYQEEGENKEKTGNTCAKWLCEYCLNNQIKIPSYHIHSNNPSGKININSTFIFYKKYEK